MIYKNAKTELIEDAKTPNKKKMELFEKGRPTSVEQDIYNTLFPAMYTKVVVDRETVIQKETNKG